MAASPEIQLLDKSTLLQPDWPRDKNHPMVRFRQWPLVMTSDLYSTCFKLRDTSRHLSLPLCIYQWCYVRQRESLWERGDMTPIFGVPQNGYNVDSFPCSCLHWVVYLLQHELSHFKLIDTVWKAEINTCLLRKRGFLSGFTIINLFLVSFEDWLQT